MGEPIVEIPASTLVAVLVGALVLPRNVGRVGFVGVPDAVWLVVLPATCLVGGAVLVLVTGFAMRNVAIGTGLAYLVGMLTIEQVYTPESPVHLLLYAVFAVLFVAGGFAGAIVRRRTVGLDR